MRAAIFDMDGVLVDTEPVYFDVNLGLFAALGIEVPDERHLSYVGISSQQMWTELKADFGLTQSVDELIMMEQDGHFGRLSEMDAIPVVAGAADLVRALVESGASLAVASSSSHRMIDLLLAKAGFDDSFPVRVSGDDVEHGKPSPDIFLEAASRLGRDACECLVIEDSPHGIRGAKAAGMLAVGYANPNSGKQDLGGADLVVVGFSGDPIRRILDLVG